MFSWRAATTWPSTSASTSTASPCSSIHGARMNTARTGSPSMPGDLEVGLEGADLAAERVAPARVVGEPEVLAVEHDHPRARPEHRRAGAHQVAQRLGEPLALDPERHRRRLAARDHEPVEPVEVGGHAHLAHLGAEAAQHARVRLEVALEREHADERRAHQPRLARSCCSSSLRDSSETIAWPRPSLARARRARRRGSAWSPRRSPRPRVAGSSDLKMPEPTNTPSAPSCIISDASAGVAMPPAQNSTTGSLPASATPRTRSSGAWCSLAAVASSDVVERLQAADLGADAAHVAHGLDDVAGARLALGADHRRALADPPQRLAEVGRAADERDLERPLVDVVGLVGRREDLGLVDVVDLERLEHLGLGEVADPRLRHDRDRHGLLDAADQQRVGHARDAAVAADVGGDALERHDGGGAGVLGDLRLLGVDDVHDDAALQHLGQAGLHPERRFVAHGTGYDGSVPTSKRSDAWSTSPRSPAATISQHLADRRSHGERSGAARMTVTVSGCGHGGADPRHGCR